MKHESQIRQRPCKPGCKSKKPISNHNRPEQRCELRLIGQHSHYDLVTDEQTHQQSELRSRRESADPEKVTQHTAIETALRFERLDHAFARPIQFRIEPQRFAEVLHCLVAVALFEIVPAEAGMGAWIIRVARKLFVQMIARGVL